MKYLLLILVCYAVKCEDISNNYFVVEIPEDDPPQPDVRDCKKPFQVYWNVPTRQCASRKILFQNLYEKFGIIQNDDDIFIGEKITILYDPGDFPAIFKNESSGKYRLRNGGVPQEGALEEHLIAFKNDLNVSIPDPDFDGIGIIDFESWRPVYRQNFGNLVPYKDVSIEIEKQLHWWWTKSMIQAEATRRFEAAAKQFMQTTLSIAKQLRPKALWGYYGFPQCFNMANNHLKENCADNVPQENNGINWLWSESTALFPSIYSSVSLSSSQLTSLINGRVRESARVRVKNTPILPYFWFRYRDAGFMTQVDLTAALNTLYKSNASGFIIWGSSNDVNTLDKCNKLYNYVETVLGPNIAKYTKKINKLNDEIDNEIHDTTLEPSTQSISNDIEYTTAAIRIGQMDPEFDWVPPKNYSEDISQKVDEELTKKGFNKSVNDEYKALNKDVVMDLIFGALINAQSNMGNKNVRQIKIGDNENYESTTLTATDFNLNDLYTEDPNLMKSSTVNDGITKNENLYNKDISSTESTFPSSEYTDSDISIESMNNEGTTQGTFILDDLTNDQNTQTYNEVSETTEKNNNTDDFMKTEKTTTTNYNLTASEEKSDYLIITEKSKNNDFLNISESIENKKTDSDFLITIKQEKREREEEEETREGTFILDDLTNDQKTQTYNEVSETTEKSTITNYNDTSSEEKSDYLIIAEKSKNNDFLNISESIENEKTDSDFLIIIKQEKREREEEETTKFHTDDKIGDLFTSQKNNEENENFRETTENSDQVVTYVYTK